MGDQLFEVLIQSVLKRRYFYNSRCLIIYMLNSSNMEVVRNIKNQALDFIYKTF